MNVSALKTLIPYQLFMSACSKSFSLTKPSSSKN
jgi:hypothetical protein